MLPTGQPDPIRDYIRKRLSEKAQTEGFSFTPQQLDEAVEHYAKSPGSEYRRAYFDEQARMGQAEAQKAQLGAGSFRDVAERTARDVGTGVLRGATSSLRALGHLGDPAVANLMEATRAAQEAQGTGFEGWLNRQSGEGAMGGRGLSSNPVIGSVQSAVEPASEMVGASPLARVAMRGTGNLLTNAANKLPESPVLRALGTLGRHEGMAGPAQAGAMARVADVARAAPRAIVKGTVGGAVAMPDETFAHGDVGTNVGMGGALSVIDALAAARVPGAKGINVSGAVRGVTDLFRDPMASLPERYTSNNAIGDASSLPVVDPATTAIQAEAPKPVSAEIGSDVPTPTTPGASAKPFTGGEPVDWANLDPTQATQARQFFAGLKTPQERAAALGAEKEMGMGGVRPKAEVVKNLTEAKGPEDLFGYLQNRLISKASGSKAKYTNKVSPRKGKIQPKVEMAGREQVVADMRGEAAPPKGADIPVATAPRPTTWVVQDLENKKFFVTENNKYVDGPFESQGLAEQAVLERSKKAGVAIAPGVEESVAAEVRQGIRPVKAKRQDVLANAPRTPEGMLDWDKMKPEQRAALKKNFGKDYREQIMTMSFDDMSKKLSAGQITSVMKVLNSKPSTKAQGTAPETAMTPAPETPATQVPEPEIRTVPTGGVSPRRKGGLTPLKVGAERVESPDDVAINRQAGIVPGEVTGKAVPVEPDAPQQFPAAEQPKFNPASWDKMDLAGRAKALEGVGVSPDRAAAMGAFNYESLPRALKQQLQSGALPAGGEAPKAAPFQGKRRSQAPQKRS